MIANLGKDTQGYLETSQLQDRNQQTVLLDGCWCEKLNKLCLFELLTIVLV